MNQLLSPDDVEDRLRRTLDARAEDMADGDGRAWNDDGALRVVPLPLDPSSRDHGPRGRRAVLAAAVLVVVVGAALAVALVRNDESDPATPSDDSPTDSTTAPPLDEDTTDSTTPSETTLPQGGPNRTMPTDWESVSLGHFERTDDPAVNYGVIWYPGWTADNTAPGAQQVEVGGNEAYVGSIAPEAEGLLQLWIVYADGVVEIQAAGMSSDDLITAATGITPLGGTDFTVTPAPGFTPG